MTSASSVTSVRPLAQPDLLFDDVAEAVHDLEDGRHSRARRRLASLWAQAPVPTAGRSAVAHWLGAAEQDVEAKTAWDQRALDAAEAATEWSAPFAGTALTLADAYPELHLELARDHRLLGSACGALEHLALARNATDLIASDGRRARLLREIAAVDRQLAGRDDGLEDWGWERDAEVDLFGDSDSDSDPSYDDGRGWC